MGYRTLVALPLLAAGWASGADPVLESAAVKATLECVGVRVSYRGDDNRNRSVTVRYREKGSAEWRVGTR